MATAIAPEYLRQPAIKKHLPESDGKPMAETDKHRQQMIDLLDALKEYCRPEPGVYITGNIFMHFRDEAGEWQSIAPDIFIVKGVEKKDRPSYNIEEEGKAPDLIIELVSRSSKVEDLGNKRIIYAGLGVKEYFLFDPTGELLSEPLRGNRLEGNEYLPMLGARLRSEVLGLDLVVEKGRLRLYDPKTGLRLLTHEESEAARKAAEAKAAQEAAARQAAEAENARLREELDRLRRSKS
jgi:Uma2 family endonuclease